MMAPPAGSRPAARTPGRRKAVRRLCRRDDCSTRSRYRRASRGAVIVAVLDASNYTFAEATWTQGLGDWIGSHIRGLEFFGGVPEIVVPDNLKSGITRSCRYEPGVNLTYEEMAQHYGIAVVPGASAKTARQSESRRRRVDR